MPSCLKKLFVATIEIVDQSIPQITHEALYSLYRDYADQLIKCEALVDAPYLLSVDISYNNLPINVSVEFHEGKYRYFSPDDGGWVEADADDLKVYEASLDWILQRIYVGFGIDPKHKWTFILDQFIWNLGIVRLERIKTPIIIARTITDGNIYRSLEQFLNSQNSNIPILVLALEKLPPYYKLSAPHVVISIYNIIVQDESDMLSFDKPLILEKMGKKVRKEGFSDGYRSANIKSKFYTFSKKQAEAVEFIDQFGGKPVHQDEIMAAISPNSSNNKLFFLFRSKKGMHPAWGVIIITDGQGNYWLEY